MKTNKRHISSAFTLIEIMLVIAIITLLLSSAFYFLGPQIAIGQDTKMRADYQAMGQALQTYENMNGSLPTTEQGLQALVTPPTTGDKPSHWYQMLQQLPKDPWQRDYVYVVPGKHNPNSYDLYSKGKDGIDGTADDKGNWDFK